MTYQIYTTRYPGQVFARFESPIPETNGYIDIPVVRSECEIDGLTYGLVESEDGRLIAAEEDDDFIGYVTY